MAGAAALVFGLWQVYRPAGWISGGALLLLYGVLATAGRKRQEREP